MNDWELKTLIWLTVAAALDLALFVWACATLRGQHDVHI